MSISALTRLLQPIRTRLANMVARGVVTLVNDSLKMQGVQLSVLDGETREGERIQQYGFTSVPLEGAEAVVVFPGGVRDHGLIVAVDDRRFRKKGLQPGEVAVYHKDGAAVVLKADGSVEVTAKAGADIIFNGGSKEVARKDDAVAATTAMGTWISSVSTALGLSPPATFGTISAGAAHVKS